MKLENVLKELQSIQTDLFIRKSEASLDVHPCGNEDDFIEVVAHNPNVEVPDTNSDGKPVIYDFIFIRFYSFNEEDEVSGKLEKIKRFINHKGTWIN